MENDSGTRYILSDTAALLKTGITTGTCATAAAKAALMHLLQSAVTASESVEVLLPNRTTVSVPICRLEKGDNNATSNGSVTAVVVKDAGDDHDITHGLEIHAAVALTQSAGKIEITGGQGVGRVTKNGLQTPVGSYAINPGPLKMIEENLSHLLPRGKGALVQISVPKGEEVSLRTFNPRLGIVGGISIIGTSGIVRPMSDDAFKATIHAELTQKKALGVKSVILVPGLHGERYAQSYLSVDSASIVHVGNFVGFGLSAAEALGFKDILLVGHIGKFIKLAGGIFNTHSKVADAKAHILIAYMALQGAPQWQIERIYTANTTDEMSDLLHQWGDLSVMNRIAVEAKRCCIDHLNGFSALDILLYDMSGRCLGDTRKRFEENEKNGAFI